MDGSKRGWKGLRPLAGALLLLLAQAGAGLLGGVPAASASKACTDASGPEFGYNSETCAFECVSGDDLHAYITTSGGGGGIYAKAECGGGKAECASNTRRCDSDDFKSTEASSNGEGECFGEQKNAWYEYETINIGCTAADTDSARDAIGAVDVGCPGPLAARTTDAQRQTHMVAIVGPSPQGPAVLYAEGTSMLWDSCWSFRPAVSLETFLEDGVLKWRLKLSNAPIQAPSPCEGCPSYVEGAPGAVTVRG